MCWICGYEKPDSRYPENFMVLRQENILWFNYEMLLKGVQKKTFTN